MKRKNEVIIVTKLWTGCSIKNIIGKLSPWSVPPPHRRFVYVRILIDPSSPLNARRFNLSLYP